MDMDNMTLVRPDPLDTSDVDGARPKALPIRLRTNHPFNTNADIEYSSPHFQQTHGKFYTQRNSNTLQPQYKLPSSSFEPLPEHRSKPRELLWTLPQKDWKPQTRDIMNWSDVEGHGRDFLFRKAAGSRDTIGARDINWPQFRCEEPSQRRTDPLRPTYIYDNGEVDQVVTHVPKYGHRYGRKPEENYNLIVKDVNGDNVHQSCYPNWLIKTRKANNTQDIPGAQVRRLRSLHPHLHPRPHPHPHLHLLTLTFTSSPGGHHVGGAGGVAAAGQEHGRVHREGDEPRVGHRRRGGGHGRCGHQDVQEHEAARGDGEISAGEPASQLSQP